jgi:hypothetical protein
LIIRIGFKSVIWFPLLHALFTHIKLNLTKMKILKLFLIALGFLSFHKTFSQTEFDFDLTGNCSYYGERIVDKAYGFSSSQEAVNVIENILSQVGLHKNFQINAASVPNAAAVIQGSTRYILYSQNFINQINNTTGSKWAAISILAHEIGHHLNGHTLERTGSRPPIELEADEFSGFVLYKMNATLNEAQLAMSTFSSSSGSSTHPPKNARLEAIAVGWNKAKEASGGSNTARNTHPNPTNNSGNNGNANPAPVIPSNQSTTVQYISKCIFNGDAFHYFITNTNLIVGLNPYTTQSMVIGQKQPSADPRFAWIYSTSTVRYGVDASGRIWSQNYLGQPVQVGHVTNP